MSDLPRNKQDFSDIDNLGRATESFMKVQRKALEQRRSVRAPRNHSTWFGAHIKQISVTAALVLVCGLAAFFGIRFAMRSDSIRQPEQTSSAADTSAKTETKQTEADSEPELTESAAASDAERQQPAVTPNNTERQSASSSTTATREATTKDEIPATTNTAASTRLTEAVSKQTQPLSTSYTAPTSAPRSSAVTTSSSRTTTASTTPTSRTTRSTTSSTTTKITTRSTTSQTTTKLTTSKTTSSSTTVTTTTTAPQAQINVLSVRVKDGYRDSSTGKYHQTIRILLRNNGTGTFSGSMPLAVGVTGSVRVIQHVGCLSGNATNIIYSSNKITVTYSSRYVAPGGDDSITLSVITDEPITGVQLA